MSLDDLVWTATTRIAYALAGFGVAALLAWAWWPEPTPSVTPGTTTASALPPAVTPPSIEVPETRTPTRPGMRAVPKTPEVRKRTKLPPAMLDGAETYIMATGALAAEERDYTLSSVLDRRTGETQVYAVADPLPLFTLATDHGAAGVYYGIKDGASVWRGALSQEVFRIKRVRAQGLATLDSDGEWFAGIGAEIRW